MTNEICGNCGTKKFKYKKSKFCWKCGTKFTPQKQDAPGSTPGNTSQRKLKAVNEFGEVFETNLDDNTPQTKPDLKAIDFLFILKDLINNIKKDYGNKIKYSSWSGIYDTIKSELKKKR